MFALAILILAAATQVVFSWNSGHDLNLPAWPSWTVWDAVDNLWLPVLFLAGVGLRSRRWLLMPPTATACVAILALLRVPEDRWLQDHVRVVFVVVAAAGAGLMKLVAITPPTRPLGPGPSMTTTRRASWRTKRSVQSNPRSPSPQSRSRVSSPAMGALGATSGQPSTQGDPKRERPGQSRASL